MSREELLQRRQAVADAAAGSGRALAVLGLGSAGLEQDRLDRYSDLDLWVIVEQGCKEAYVTDLGWLSAAGPIAFKFKHSPSGYGILFSDGIFAEIDVFELDDLATLGFTAAAIIWKAPGVPDSLRRPRQEPQQSSRAPEEILGEALGNLYVGLGRFYRGEKLSAMRFVQVYAIDQLIRLIGLVEPEQQVRRDPFSIERRAEARFPTLARELPNLLLGYERTPESARAILEFLDRHFSVDESIKRAILERLAEHSA